ncbi:WAT1-related protein At1g68170-like [Lotus japonicus]|uniref:WAT1-related protein At1g68170-like n=1 Tax=Lotus japonicus TaxID=34305 RepID=UPI00258283E2|nr:WAT1-related protein At1g68170-like [Lotus japonicus]
MMKGICNVVQGLKPALLMVLVQIAFAGVNVLYKLAVNNGMSLRVVVAYRFIFATAFIAPLAFILERKKRTKMTWTILFQSFLCGLFGGSLAQNFYLEALALTSATFASAMSNLVPAITFIMAVSFGLEKLNLRTAAGKAKIVGTLTGIGGAMVLTFVKGIDIKMGSFHINLLHYPNGAQHSQASTTGGKTLLGSLCALASGISYALWLIIQTKMSEKYPTHYSSTALMSFWGSIISVVFALCVERDWSQWRLGWNVRLLTVAYSGMVVSGAMVVVISWCVRMRGPLFVSVFSPLMLVMVVIAGSTMLNEQLHLGCIIGAVLIVCGLYAVLWGKSEEMKKRNQLVPTTQSPHHESNDAVEIVVRSGVVEDKSNLSSQDNGVQVVRDNEDSPDGQDKSSHAHNTIREY